MRLKALLAVFLSLWAVSAYAQFKASIQGTVQDSKGGVVAGANNSWFLSDTTSIAKLPGAHGTSARAQYDLRERWERYEALNARSASLDAEQPTALRELRWLIEEYAVSLFAQELKTSVTVSPKRLDEAQRAAHRAVDALR